MDVMHSEIEHAPGEPVTSENNVWHEPGITPGLVKEVADKVFAMLLSELRIEKERYRLQKRSFDDHSHNRGGW